MKRLAAEGAAVDEAPMGASAGKHMRESGTGQKRSTAMHVVLAVLSVVAVVAVVYGVGYVFFSSHYCWGTNIAGIDASSMSEQEFATALASKVQNYTATITNGSFSMSVPGPKIDFACDDALATARQVMEEQDPSWWPVLLVAGGRNESSVFSLDASKLAGLVDDAVASYNEDATMPTSAELVLNDDEDGFLLRSEKEGTAISAEYVSRVAANAIMRGETTIALNENALVQPQIRAEDSMARSALRRANDTLDYGLSFARKGKVVARLSAEDFAKWLFVRPRMLLGIDEEEVALWVKERLWEVADYADDTNVYVVDHEALASALNTFVGTGSDEAVEIPYVSTPRYLPGGGKLATTPWDANRGRYIDIDKKNQVACLYDATGRVLWETPVTTGNEAAGNGTPVGEFGIYDMVTDFVLIGRDGNGDGKPDYENHVDYWMPFNGNIGMHDAFWRKVYGGTEYLQNGSGGCVNLPKDAAAALYAMTHINEAVIVHN